MHTLFRDANGWGVYFVGPNGADALFRGLKLGEAMRLVSYLNGGETMKLTNEEIVELDQWRSP
jgi:hypothetical protein